MVSAKVALLALAGVGAVALGSWGASAHGGFGRHGHHRMVHKFIDFAVNEKLDEIGATPAQKEKVLAIKDRVMRRGEALRGERAAFHRDLVALLEQDSVDSAQVKALVRPRIDAFAQFADEAADAVAELHGVLTPDQRRKLLAEAREHAARHGRE